MHTYLVFQEIHFETFQLVVVGSKRVFAMQMWHEGFCNYQLHTHINAFCVASEFNILQLQVSTFNNMKFTYHFITFSSYIWHCRNRLGWLFGLVNRNTLSTNFNSEVYMYLSFANVSIGYIFSWTIYCIRSTRL